MAELISSPAGEFILVSAAQAWQVTKFSRTGCGVLPARPLKAMTACAFSVSLTDVQKYTWRRRLQLRPGPQSEATCPSEPSCHQGIDVPRERGISLSCLNSSISGALFVSAA